MSQEPKSKLIIDEDWKTQVQREKEAAKKQAETSPVDAASRDTGQPASASPPHVGEAGQLPPASFSLLVTMLATQALVACGVLHDPSQGEPTVEPALAKHFTDLLGMLEEKTKGNLTPEESSLLTQTLHELRMMYVTLSTHGERVPARRDKPAGDIVSE